MACRGNYNIRGQKVDDGDRVDEQERGEKRDEKRDEDDEWSESDSTLWRPNPDDSSSESLRWRVHHGCSGSQSDPLTLSTHLTNGCCSAHSRHAGGTVSVASAHVQLAVITPRSRRTRARRLR